MAAAEAAHFQGWDFSWLNNRWVEAPLPWSYETLVRRALPDAAALLDMGTGGGEFLAGLAPLPPTVVATENWAPNVPVARARLAPLGITVVSGFADHALPLASAAFDLIINRHESYELREMTRLLRPNGLFLTQQAGAMDVVELNDLLAAPHPEIPGWSLENELAAAAANGLQPLAWGESLLPATVTDIGAVVYFLRAIPWQIADFSVAGYERALRALHERITRDGSLQVTTHRFFYLARRQPDQA